MSKPKKKTKDKDSHPKLANFEAELDEGAVCVENNGKIYDFKMDVKGFSPEEIKLQITKTHVKIDALHETEEEISEISEEIELPEGIDAPGAVEVTVNKNGVLRIYAPIAVQVIPEIKTKVIREEKRTERVMVSAEQREVIEEIIETHFFDYDPEKLDPKFQDASKDIVKSDSGDNFKLSLDLPGFTKDEINVNVYKTVATIEAKKKEPAGPGKLEVEIFKKVNLPKQTQRKTLTSVMDVKNGRFSFTGLLKTPKQVKAPKEEKVFEVKRIPAEKKPITQDVQIETIVDPKGGLTKEEAQKVEDITDKLDQVYDGKKFETKIDVSKFRPEEIEVKALKNVVTVKAESDEKKEDQIYKMFKLPPRVKHENIQTTYTVSGSLKISSVLEEFCTVQTKILTNDPVFTPPTATVKAENFKQVLDMTGYRPEEIEVTIKNGWITIKGKQVAGVYDFKDFRSRQFTRKFTIPNGVSPEQIKTEMDPVSNILVITVAR